MSKKKICWLTAGVLLGVAVGTAVGFMLIAPEEMKHCPCCKLRKKEDA